MFNITSTSLDFFFNTSLLSGWGIFVFLVSWVLHEKVLDFFECHLCICQDDHMVCFILLMWYIVGIDYFISNQKLGLKTTCSWCIILSICCCIPFSSIFIEYFLHPCSSWILVCPLLVVVVCFVFALFLWHLCLGLVLVN